MFRVFLCLLCFCCCRLWSTEEIIVPLSTEKTLSSLYFSFVAAADSGLESSYCKQLENILQFDFDHNGKNSLVSSLTQMPQHPTFDPQLWNTLGINYVVNCLVINKTLSIDTYDVQHHRLKKIENIPLMGDLTKDRATLHLIADAIHADFFGFPGIAHSRILYTTTYKKHADASQWFSEVWEMDYDGGNARQITQDHTLCVSPLYIPQLPQHFLFVSYKEGQPKMYVAPLASGVGKRLSTLRGDQLMPHFSSQGDFFVFVSDVTGNPELFLQEFSLKEGAKGLPRQIFAAPSGAQGCPTIDPDGKKVAFTSNKDGSARIYIIDIPPPRTLPSQPLLITKENPNNTCPQWSPDGKKIAYSSLEQGTRQIWIYDLETAEETPLTTGPGHKENPTWAANSLHLIYDKTTQWGTDLYLINLNQKKSIKITHGEGEKRFPSWKFS